MSYKIEYDHREILDMILPFFELNETVNVRKNIREVLAKDHNTLIKTPINTYSEIIKQFLIKYKFARGLVGEAVINRKGMALKNAGSLSDFERLKTKMHDFIVIDDDNFNNVFCNKVILSTSPGSDIKTFTDPNLALRYLHDAYTGHQGNDVVLLLDINMPTLLGWDVLQEFNSFPENIKNCFRIYMLSSSVNPKDIERAESDPNVWGYIEKPLSDIKVRLSLFDDDSLN